jgi:hypothetical protein
VRARILIHRPQGRDRVRLPQITLAEQHRRALALLAAADEAREAACNLHDADALIHATTARYRAREILTATNRETFPLDPRCPAQPLDVPTA